MRFYVSVSLSLILLLVHCIQASPTTTTSLTRRLDTSDNNNNATTSSSSDGDFGMMGFFKFIAPLGQNMFLLSEKNYSVSWGYLDCSKFPQKRIMLQYKNADCKQGRRREVRNIQTEMN